MCTNICPTHSRPKLTSAWTASRCSTTSEALGCRHPCGGFDMFSFRSLTNLDPALLVKEKVILAHVLLSRGE